MDSFSPAAFQTLNFHSPPWFGKSSLKDQKLTNNGTSEELNKTFAKVRNILHLDEETAEFAPLSNPKIRWCKTIGHAEFSVTHSMDTHGIMTMKK